MSACQLVDAQDMAGYLNDISCHTDSFGGSTSVKVNAVTSDSSLARYGVVLASMVIVPMVPLIGAVLGLMSRKRIEENSLIQGRRKAAYAFWAGSAVAFAQALLVSLAVSAAWGSIENAKSLIATDAMLVNDGSAIEDVVVRPEFELHRFWPGSTRTFEVNANGAKSIVRVRFNTSLTWTGSGFIFDASVLDRPSELAIHSESE